MHGGVQREDDAERDQSADDDDRGVGVRREQQRDRRRQRGQREREQRRGPPVGLVRAAEQARSRGLHGAVADHPEREERADLPEAPAKLAAQEDGQADDEPDVARGEQGEPSGGEHVHGPALREHLREAGVGVGPAELSADLRRGDEQRDQHKRGQREQRDAEADEGEEQAAEEEADTLERVLRARQDRHPAKELVGSICGGDKLDRALRAHLGQVLGDSRERLRGHHVGHDEPGSGHEGECEKRNDLRREAGEQRRLEAEARRDPAADEVRDDAEELVEQEQRGDGEGRVAALVEEEQHEHAACTVGDRAGPVRRRHEGVGAQIRRARRDGIDRAHRSATIRASSTRRFA